ncbi:hypothetical protein RhiirA5_439812 [Rhizophagus irregularis]|uniref:Uncharacterized protein n=1 Tax=Rhizophagus irregularis TaxID=588596 RepID=A0A2N0NHF7_9GLOM|nr:hypothetical protein RhiirA5_439812 [Rhizophagus irregularis]
MQTPTPNYFVIVVLLGITGDSVALSIVAAMLHRKLRLSRHIPYKKSSGKTQTNDHYREYCNY